MESRKMIKFLSYVKKFLAMLSLSLVVSISLFNKSVLAIDPAKVTINSNGITYVDSYQPRVSYELSADNKSFSAIVGDEGATVYSKVSYTGDDQKELTLPVTSISADKGVAAFTLNLIDTKNDKVKIIPSGYGDLTVTLNYNGNLSQAEARKIFEGTEFEDIWMDRGNAIKLIIRKLLTPDAKSSESIIESSPQSSEISYSKSTSSSTSSGTSNRGFSSPHYLIDRTSSADIYENTNKEIDKKLAAWKAEHPDATDEEITAKRKELLAEELEDFTEEQKKSYNYEAGKAIYEYLVESVYEDFNKWLAENPNATEDEQRKKKEKLFDKKYDAISDEDKKLVDGYLNEEINKVAEESNNTPATSTTSSTNSGTSYTASSSSKAQKSKIVYYYVDEHGKTSTEITEYGMIWLKETSDGTSAWYGIDNSDGTFKIGSKFWVKWLSPKIDREEFEEYYNKLDEEHKKKVDNNNLWIFLTGVTDPDGNEYTNFYGNLNYYIQIGEDWDQDDINVVFISGNKDSVLDVSYVTLECPEGKDEFAKVIMKHFSPYAIYDEKDEIKTSNVFKSAYIKTGESVSELIFMFWVSLLLVAFLNRKMNKNSICS